VSHGTDPGALGSIYSGPLTSIPLPTTDPGSYYWKVDAVDPIGTFVGDVWSYSIGEWISLDIGGSWGGSATYDEPSQSYTVIGDGGDIWAEADSFQYYYHIPDNLTRGDVTITAKVASITGGTSGWRKAGVMIRDSRDAGSKHAMMAATPQNTTLQYRPQTNQGSSDQTDWSQASPSYVKLQRDGDLFIASRSNNGTDWIQVGSTTIEMSQDILLGFAVTSHDWGALTTAVFEELSITTPDPRKSWAPDPEDGADGVPMIPTLSWGEGINVMLNIIYFADNYDDVASGDAYAGTKLPGNNTYAPGILNLNQTYYFAVDELSGFGHDLDYVPGDIWSFTVTDHRPVEDFEAYDIEPEAPPAQTLVESVICPPGQSEEEPPDTIIAVAPPTDGDLYPALELDDGAVIFDDPERGLVLALDGDGDYVDCGNPAALNFGTGDGSVSAWIKSTVGDDQGAVFGNGGDGGGGHRYTLGLGESNDDKITLVVDDNASKKSAHSDTPVADGVWHNVIGVRDGDTIRVYIDGIPDGTEGLPAGYDLSGTSQRPVLIGAIYHHGDNRVQKHYTGLIDDVQIYDSALTEDNALFLAELGGVAPASAPLANWAFEGNFEDSSGNNYHGTAMGYQEIPAHYGPMIAHYEFEGNADDSSANANHGCQHMTLVWLACRQSVSLMKATTWSAPRLDS
jgi:hypothetical protein